jgi:hypothetical protein
MDKNNDLTERLLEFERRVHEFLQTIQHSHDNITIQTQLAKSARSTRAKQLQLTTRNAKHNALNYAPCTLQLIAYK